MNYKNLRHKIENKEKITGYNYKNIPIFCSSGVHEKIFEDFSSLNKNKNIKILVLGSGAGAFEQRLLDNNYRDITSVEFIPENFMIKETKLLSLDLNQDFSDIGKFDAVFAIEIIEHLENQFHFIRCVKKLLKSDGVFYLSTPSVENTFARIKYLLMGILPWFSPEQLTGTGDISPIFNHILKFNLAQSNLKIEKYFTNGNVWKRALKNPNLLNKIGYCLLFPLTFLVKNRDNFEIKLYRITNNN